MSVGDVIGAGVGLFAGDRQANAAEDAARAQREAAEQGRADIRDYYDQFAGNAQPYMQAGTSALGDMQRFLGGDYSAALSSPDYTARFAQGLQGLDRSAAARGSLMGGRHTADTIQYGQDRATEGLNNYWGRLTGVAGMGAGMTSNLGGAGLNAAGMMAQQGNIAGQARASGYTGAADAWGQTAFGLGGLINNAGQSNGWWGSSANTKPWGKG
jgi:hypothetical protein